ncbi:uncharacterized protein LOC124936965 isoform X2 [Impatiens glandulifera]|uniref:uncharacterized protein LOC124936965 isoform X2 n=1 Tax=Impatiens glandulifera TaxID=253017 RepID=UPI001FB1099F|nr:uncharacterized protein LOC124936965 isoform X2 [Impatiens glandulifera]
MVNGKRWSVTYTKHIKQKRKVYQDGYLELETSANKITLYDDCEKLLGSRIVKIGDNVSSGETIAFDSYLVDIGEVDGGCAPVTSLNEDCVLIVKENFQQKNRKITETVGLGHGNRFRHNLLPSDTKPILRKNITSSKLSPSQRIIQG